MNKNNVVLINKLKRFYDLTKILLIITPIIVLIYLHMVSIKESLSVQDIILKYPEFSIMILVAVINLFIAYLISFIEKNIREDRLLTSLINLFVFMITQLFLQNLFYTILFGVVIFKTYRAYNISIKDFSKIYKEQKILSSISGSIIVFVLSCICLFANMRIYGII